MQLKDKNVRRALAIATCSVLGTPVSTQAAEESDWSMDISGLHYAEKSRVTVDKVESVLRKDAGDGEAYNFTLVYDTMTGASPNGRFYTGAGDTGSVSVTTASGFAFDVSGGTTAAAGAEPWLTEFADTRIGLNFDWEKPIVRNFTTFMGLGYSKENDYTSIGGNITGNVELAQKRTTLSLGASVSLDKIDPKGGIPEGLGRLECADQTPNLPNWIDCDVAAKRYVAGDKATNEFLIGLTQVWNRRTLMQFNYTMGDSSGYLTDPYKQISVIDNDFNSEIAVLYEKRPSERVRQSLYWKLVTDITHNVLNLSYRYFWDNWQVKSHTLDTHYRWEISPKHYLQPHLRYSMQSAAFFYGTYIGSNEDKPEYFSADHRLGDQNTMTVGLKYGVKLGKNGEVALRGELIQQDFGSNPLPNNEITVFQGSVKLNF